MDNYMEPFVDISVKKGILECSILFLVFVRKVTHYFLTPSQNLKEFSNDSVAVRGRVTAMPLGLSRLTLHALDLWSLRHLEELFTGKGRNGQT